MSLTDPVLAQLAARLRSLTEGFAAEVGVVVPIRDGAYAEPVVVATGSRKRVAVNPQTIFRPALRLRAAEVVIAHNHLDASPVSDADRAVTRRLLAAGVLLGVPLQAHLVLTPEGWSDCCRSGNGWMPYAGDAVA
ncbi:MAG: JAB domain-containing protein [Stackebrandtia sp.]